MTYLLVMVYIQIITIDTIICPVFSSSYTFSASFNICFVEKLAVLLVSKSGQ